MSLENKKGADKRSRGQVTDGCHTTHSIFVRRLRSRPCLQAWLPFWETRGHGMTAISSHGLLVVRIQFGSLRHSFHSETAGSNQFAAMKRYRVRVVTIKRNSLTSSTPYN